MPAIRDLDGLRNPETGALNEPVATAKLEIPSKVEVDGTLLKVEQPFYAKTRPVPRDLLDKFLAVRTPGDASRFAAKFGTLHLPTPLDVGSADIETWLLQEQPRFFGIREPQALDYVEYERRKGDAVFKLWREPLAWWFRYREQFQQLLAAAVAIREERSPVRPLASLPNPSGLTALLLRGWDNTPMEKRPLRAQVADACRILWSETEDLVQQFGLVPRLSWSKPLEGPEASRDSPRLTLEFSDATGRGRISLLGALTVQLLGAIAGTGFAVCSHCGSVFSPSRRPASDRRSYCKRQECKKASLLDAKAAYRKRQREERQLHSQRSVRKAGGRK